MQDVFIKAFARLKGFRGESGLSTWLYRIAHNACIDHQRRKRWQTVTELFGHRKPPEQTEPPMDGPVQQPDQSLAAVEINGEIQVALDTLTAMERSVFVLRHMQELSTRQTAQVLQCSEGAVKNMLFRACKKLRTDLESRGVTV